MIKIYTSKAILQNNSLILMFYFLSEIHVERKNRVYLFIGAAI